jgi:hypothetical protein
MSIAPLSTSTAASSSTPTRTQMSEHIDVAKPASSSSILSEMTSAVAAGVSATVAFSGDALHALESVGETVVDGAEDLAVGAWHGLESAATGVAHASEAVAGTVEDGVGAVVSEVKNAAKELGHYIAVGMQTTGDAVSEVASGTVMAASAGGKTLAALV